MWVYSILYHTPKSLPLVADSKIRILNAGVYVHTDATLSVGGSTATPFPCLYPQGTNTSICVYFYWDVNNQGYGFYKVDGTCNKGYIAISQPSEFHASGNQFEKIELLWHELGHALGGLADHYYDYPAAQHFGKYDKANSINYAGNMFPINAVYLPDDSSVDPSYTISCAPTATNAQNNVMGGTSCRQYLSARQIAAFHYYVAQGITSTLTANFNPNIPPYLAYPYFPAVFNPTITACINLTGTQTITSSFLFDNIAIKTGADITFSNVVLYAKINSSRITIEKGAKLTLRCSEIKPRTNYDEWQGIEIDGTPNVNQYVPGYQGVLEMYDSKITRAITGVLVGRTAYGVNIANTGGGWVIANNSVFYECLKGLEMLPSVNAYNNLTTFTDCKFMFTTIRRTALSDPQIIGAKLDGVKNVKFYGCLFDPDQYATTYYSPKHYGIKAFNSSVIVKPSATNSTYFERFLDYGIHMTGFGNLVVEDSYFRTRNGIFAEGLTSARAVRNDFEMNSTAPIAYNVFNTGIYLSSFNNFKIENNNFKCWYPITTTLSTEGIVVDHTGPYSSNIYNNTFDRVFMGIWCQDQNYDPSDLSGLQINCNDFINCSLAFGTQAKNPITGYYTGIAWTQGVSNSQIDKNVRNTYTNCTYRFWKNYIPFSNHVEPPTVIHGSFVDAPFSVGPQPLYSLPNHVADLNNNINAPSTREDYCTNTSANRPLGYYTAQVDVINLDLQNHLLNYNQLLDGGSTGTMLDYIQDSQLDEEVLYNDYINTYSPYLSDTVLKSYFLRPNVPESFLKKCFENNAPVNDQTWSFISGLGMSIQTDLESIQYPYHLSERAKKEAEISLVKSAQHAAVTDKLNCLLATDSIENLKDSIAELILINGQGDIDKQLIDLDLAFEDYSSATSRLSNYPINGELQRYQYKNYKELYIEMMRDSSGKYALINDTTLFSQINRIANDSTHPCVKEAQGLLSSVFNTYFNEEKLVPDQGEGGGTAGRSANNQDSDLISQGLAQLNNTIKNKNAKDPVKESIIDGLTVFPNPAKESFTILNSTNKQYLVKITDVTGRLLKEQTIAKNNYAIIDVNAFLNGIYFVNLFNGSVFIKTSKIVVAK